MPSLTLPWLACAARKNTGGRSRDDLEWDDDLATYAESWAQQNASQNQMRHSSPNDREGQGENLFAAMPEATFEAAAKAWVSEKKDYHGGPIDDGYTKYGHYTQVRSRLADLEWKIVVRCFVQWLTLS